MRNKKAEVECLGEEFRGDCNRGVNGGEKQKRGRICERTKPDEWGPCVFVCSEPWLWACVYVFQRPSVDWLPHTRFPQLPSAPLKHTQEGHKSPPRLLMAPKRILFRSCSPFCCPVKRVSLVRDWWVTPSFDVKSLEHACSSTKDREREREGEKQRRELLNNFSHMLALQKGRRGGENSIPSTVRSRVKTDGWDDNGPGAPRTPAQSSHSSFY